MNADLCNFQTRRQFLGRGAPGLGAVLQFLPRLVASDATAAIEEAVRREIDAKLFPGAVVLIGAPDRVLHHEAFGFAQVEPQRVPMRRDSIFDVASITKVVCTATAAGICKDRGLHRSRCAFDEIPARSQGQRRGEN